MSDLITQLSAALGAGFRIERELGGGGMSRVFLAEELALGRRVVVKALPPEFAADSGAERFQRETRVVASLQHPNIVPIIAAGGDANLLWFTMPFIEGESLRDRLTREAELPVAEALRLWSEILDALAYAHARGIVHRDIKPENVLLSGRHALVADFGIARALSSTLGGARATATGLAIGTPAYMSPEQAVGDPNVDVRADIYSAALVMYEMLTGVMPFNERSPARLIVAHASQPVPPVRERRPQVSPALEALLMRCLEKRPADRPQSAEDVLRALAQLPDAAGYVSGDRGTPASAPSRSRRLLLAGVAAVAVVGAAFGANAWRSRTAAPAAFADSSRVAVLVLPPVYEPADSLLARGAMDILASAVKNDRRLAWVDPLTEIPPGPDERIAVGIRSRDSLLRWSRDLRVHSHVSYTLARAGSGYLLGVAVRAVQSDSALYVRQLSAATAADIPQAAETLAREATAALARAFGRIRRPTPDGAAMRISPDAAQNMLEGDDLFARRDYAAAANKYRAVLREDSTVAVAWLNLGFALSNAGYGTDERLRAYAAAYRHRGTLPFASQRRNIEWEYLRLTGRWEDAIAFYQQSQREGEALNPNNYGLLLLSLRRYDDGVQLFSRIRDTTNQMLLSPSSNYVVALLDLGRIAEARAASDAMEGVHGPEHPVVGATRLEIARALRQPDSILAVARAQAKIPRGTSARLGNLSTQRAAELQRGALGSADERHAERQQLLRESELAADAFGSALLYLGERANLLGATDALRGELASLYSRDALNAIAPLDRPWSATMTALARLGRLDEARAISAAADRDIPEEFRLVFQVALASGRLEIALAEGNGRAALEQARLRDRGACAACAFTGYARAWDAAGNADSALVYYDRYLDATSSRVSEQDAQYHAVFLVRSGELREARGDIAGALARYREFVDRWRSADPALQARVRNVQERIARLEARRG